MKSKKQITLLLLFFTHLSFSQMFYDDGEIFHRDMTSTKGKIKQINQNTIEFIGSENQTIKFKSSELLSYSIEDSKYISADIVINDSKTNCFLKQFVFGPICLYEIQKGQNNSNYAVKNENGEIFGLSNVNSTFTELQIDVKSLL